MKKIANQVKLLDSEMDELRSIQDSFQQKINQFGQLYLQKIHVEATVKAIEDQETKLKEELENIQKTENQFMNTLLTKYGKGSLDLKTGIFTNIPEEVPLVPPTVE